MSVVITSPQKIKVLNTGKIENGFVPYKENFTCALAPETGVEFEVKSASEALYYLNLGIAGLEITAIENFDVADNIDDVSEENVDAMMDECFKCGQY